MSMAPASSGMQVRSAPVPLAAAGISSARAGRGPGGRGAGSRLRAAPAAGRRPPDGVGRRCEQRAADRWAEGHACREAETVKRHVTAEQTRWCELGDEWAEHANCAHSPIAIAIATSAKTVVPAGVERVSVASRTARRPTANNAPVAAKAGGRRVGLTTPGAGGCGNKGRGGGGEKKARNSPP